MQEVEKRGRSSEEKKKKVLGDAGTEIENQVQYKITPCFFFREKKYSFNKLFLFILLFYCNNLILENCKHCKKERSFKKKGFS